MVFILTQYLQFALGYSPLAAGCRLLPWALVFMAAAPRSARLVERFGYRLIVSTGLSIAAGGLALLAMNGAHANDPLLALSMVVIGAGMSLVTAPSTGAIIASLPLHKAGVGSAVNDTTREVGGALGVAVMGSVLSSIYRGGLPANAGPARESIGAALRRTPALAHTARHAWVHGFGITNLVMAGVALATSGVVSWLLRATDDTGGVSGNEAVLEAA
jgi:MFS family permease